MEKYLVIELFVWQVNWAAFLPLIQSPFGFAIKFDFKFNFGFNETNLRNVVSLALSQTGAALVAAQDLIFTWLFMCNVWSGTATGFPPSVFVFLCHSSGHQCLHIHSCIIPRINDVTVPTDMDSPHSRNNNAQCLYVSVECTFLLLFLENYKPRCSKTNDHNHPLYCYITSRNCVAGFMTLFFSCSSDVYV